jgi:acetylornithine deacetylase
MAGPTTPVDFIRRLVAFDTTSSKSNLALIEFVAGVLRGQGIKPHLVPGADGAKASLFATIGPNAPSGVVLSGHTDVVPVTDQAWTDDPFVVVERDGRLYGRGTADMKGFIAVALAMVPEFRARTLRVPIHLAFSYDEEVGCLSAPDLIERIVRVLPKPALAIVGEPSEMKVANAHRGITTFVTTVTGRPGHASAPDAGVNAIACAAECIAHLGRIAGEFAGDQKFGKFAADREPGDPPVPEHTTLNVGRIEGGSAVNIIAAHCRFVWECRPAPGVEAADVRSMLETFTETELLPRMRKVAPEAAIATEQTVAVPALVPEVGSPAETLALALTGQNRCGGVPFASEAGMFQGAGIPAVVCGPGSPAQAHQPDEFVALDQVDACAAFMHRLADWAERR